LRLLGVLRHEDVVDLCSGIHHRYDIVGFNIIEKETEMKRQAALLAMLILGLPTLALAAEHSAGYRGIGMLYFTFMAAILIYGVYDTFGKKAMYVAAPIIVVGLYLLLPES
jgi:hypothetical protein